MSDGEFLTDLCHIEESHDGKVHPDLVSMAIRHFDVNKSMHWNKLELGIGHDTVGIESLSWFVEPDGFIGPPKCKIRPISIPCWIRKGEGRGGEGRAGEGKKQ